MAQIEWSGDYETVLSRVEFRELSRVLDRCQWIECGVVCIGEHSLWSRWTLWLGTWFSCRPTLRQLSVQDNWWLPSKMFSRVLKDFSSNLCLVCHLIAYCRAVKFWSASCSRGLCLNTVLQWTLVSFWWNYITRLLQASYCWVFVVKTVVFMF